MFKSITIFIALCAAFVLGMVFAQKNGGETPVIPQIFGKEAVKASPKDGLPALYINSLSKHTTKSQRYNKDETTAQLVKRWFKKFYPYMLDAFVESRNTYEKSYYIEKYQEKPKAYFGSPEFLGAIDVEDGIDTELDVFLDIDVEQIIKENGLERFIGYTKNPKEAQIFIIPVRQNSVIALNTMYTLGHRAAPKFGFGSLLDDTVMYFPNTKKFWPPGSSSQAMMIKDADNNIMATICPVDSEFEPYQVSAVVHYCMIAGLGLPKFYHVENVLAANHRETYREKIDQLLQLHTCDQLKDKKNYFDIDFTPELLKACVK